jgi:hypothetical protein
MRTPLRLLLKMITDTSIKYALKQAELYKRHGKVEKSLPDLTAGEFSRSE